MPVEVLFWVNLVGYQLAWLITVYGAGHGQCWPGVVAGSTFSVAHLVLSDRRWLDLRLVAMAVAFGLLSDGLLAALDLIRYNAADPAVPVSGGAPLWIIALWSAFAVTLNRSLAWLQRRPWVAVVFGALGGPLAYSSAARGWGALEFLAPAWRGELWLAVSWAIAMYSFGRVIRLGGSVNR